MNSLHKVWNCSSLGISTEVHLSQALMRCQRHILNVCRWAHDSNAEVLQRSSFSTVGDILRHRRLSLFGRIARLDPRVPAHDALRLTVDIPIRKQKGNGQLEKTTGSPSQRLAQWGSGLCQRSTAAIYAVEI